METIDKAISIWQQVALEHFKTALEAPPKICPVCGGEADIIRVQISGNGTKEVPCVCRTALHARRVWDDCLLVNQIDIQDEGRRIDQLKPYSTPENWKTLTDAWDSLKSLIASPLCHDWITIHGIKGCGKSHLIHSARHAIRKYAVYFYCPTLGDEIFKSLDDENTIQLKRRLINAPVLFLDDLGAEVSKSEFVNQFLNSVIGERYQRGLYAPTVVTTNMTGALLDGRYDRMASRILDKGQTRLHHIKLPDYRQSKERAHEKRNQ